MSDEINSTSTDDNGSNGEEDVLYQRGASFSAKLDISDLHISMKPFSDDDDEENVGDSETNHPTNRPRQSLTKNHPPSNANANSILVDDELARRKANRNWKLEPSSQQSANMNEARATRTKPSRKEKSIQNDGLPVLVTAFGHDGVRRVQPKTSVAGSDRRKVNATSGANRQGGLPDAVGAIDGTTGSSNMPPASDMEIGGISLHSSPSGGRWQRADVPETATSSASAALLAVDDDDDDDDDDDVASEIRALPLVAGSMEDEGMPDTVMGVQRGGKLSPDAMGRGVAGHHEPMMQGVDADGLAVSPGRPDNATQQTIR
uniref:Uncharacterized protein n=1 Tax=Anopheles farauti TaxID=69004 RepID=A0A182QD37_9DIPT